MAHTKQVSKRKRRRIALPALGAAGASLVMVGGAAANAPTANAPSLQDTSLRPASLLMRRKSPTSAWRRFMSSTRKTIPSSAKA